MSIARLSRSLVLCLAAASLLLLSPAAYANASGAASGTGTVTTTGDPLPAGGTVTEIDALIETNLTIGSGSTIPLTTHSAKHSKCDSQTQNFVASIGRWEFTNSFQTLQATFEGTPIGTIVITKNPKLPINGVHTTLSDQPVFPVHSKIRLFLQVKAMGQTLVNRDPIILEGDVNAWPQVGAVYQATSGPVDFFAVDSAGDPTGAPVAQLFGTRVTVEAGRTLSTSADPSPSTTVP